MARTPSPTPDSRMIDEIRRALLAWYRVHRRDLPWRSGLSGGPGGPGGPDPYRVLVSEAMLQQTRVAVVIDYFERFLKAFPTAEALAAADEQRVLLLWQGLGYYRRARSLHAAAKEIVERHGGKIPADPAAIAALPGVGRYTSGAIASIAFGIRAPILDGNVARVLARWFVIEEAIDKPEVRARLWLLAGLLVPDESPGDFNQAMMELGALVCTPRNPRCLACPMMAMCGAYARGVAGGLPVRSPKRRPRPVVHHAVASRRGNKFVFEQRPPKGPWAGLWQLPTAEDFNARATPEAVRAWASRRLALKMEPPREAGVFQYQTTHRSIRCHVWIAEAGDGRLLKARGVWRSLEDLRDLPFSTMQRKVILLLRGAV